MRQRAVLLVGGVALLGLAAGPAVAATYEDGPVAEPLVATQGVDGGEKTKAPDGDEQGADTIARQLAALHRAHHNGAGVGPSEMAALHRAHHNGAGVGPSEMAALHRAHHGGEAEGPAEFGALHRSHHGEGAEADDPMGGPEMMGGASHMGDAG